MLPEGGQMKLGYLKKTGGEPESPPPEISSNEVLLHRKHSSMQPSAYIRRRKETILPRSDFGFHSHDVSPCYGLGPIRPSVPALTLVFTFIEPSPFLRSWTVSYSVLDATGKEYYSARVNRTLWATLRLFGQDYFMGSFWAKPLVIDRAKENRRRTRKPAA